MIFLMCVSVGRLCKCLSANITSERFFTVMIPHMNVKIVLGLELLAAYRAREALCRGVSEDVFFQVTLAYKSLAADITLERPPVLEMTRFVIVYGGDASHANTANRTQIVQFCLPVTFHVIVVALRIQMKLSANVTIQ